MKKLFSKFIWNSESHDFVVYFTLHSSSPCSHHYHHHQDNKANAWRGRQRPPCCHYPTNRYSSFCIPLLTTGLEGRDVGDAVTSDRGTKCCLGPTAGMYLFFSEITYSIYLLDEQQLAGNNNRSRATPMMHQTAARFFKKVVETRLSSAKFFLPPCFTNFFWFSFFYLLTIFVQIDCTYSHLHLCIQRGLRRKFPSPLVCFLFSTFLYW